MATRVAGSRIMDNDAAGEEEIREMAERSRKCQTRGGIVYGGA